MSIEAMRLADELDCRGMNRPSWKDQFDAGYELRRLHKENIELRQAIEQAQKQEPVIWMYQDKSTHEVRFQKHMSEFVDHSRTSEVPLYGEPLANHELQCVCGAVWCGDEMVHLPNKSPQLQPLTSKQIREIEVDVATNLSLDYPSPAEQFTRAIEAAHGIKGDA